MTRPLAAHDVSVSEAAPESRAAGPPPGVALAGMVGNRAMTRALSVQRDPVSDVRTMSITPQLQGANLPLDPGAELVPVSTVALSSYGLVVAAGNPLEP